MSRLSRLLPVFGAILMISAGARAASTPPADTGPGQTIAAIPLDSAAISFGQVMQAHAEVLRETKLRPAPLPDPDMGPPGPSSDALSAQADPKVAPGFFNPQQHFSGDGYAPGSSIDTDQYHRHTTGGGMNLSIPMQ